MNERYDGQETDYGRPATSNNNTLLIVVLVVGGVGLTLVGLVLVGVVAGGFFAFRSATAARQSATAARQTAVIQEIAAEQSAKVAENARQVIEKRLGETQRQGMKIRPITSSSLTRLFLDFVFFAGHYGEWPRPEAEGPSRVVFVVAKGGEIQQCTNTQELQKFFQGTLKPVQSEEDYRTAATAWLWLSQEFRQDGYFTFQIDPNALAVSPTPDAKKAVGKVNVLGGGSGALDVTLTFDKDGKLTEVSESSSIKAGSRPKGP